MIEATDDVEDVVLVVFGSIAAYGIPPTVINGGREFVEDVVLIAKAEVIEYVVGIVKLEVELGWDDEAVRSEILGLLLVRLPVDVVELAERDACPEILLAMFDVEAKYSELRFVARDVRRVEEVEWEEELELGWLVDDEVEDFEDEDSDGFDSEVEKLVRELEWMIDVEVEGVEALQPLKQPSEMSQ